MTTATPVANRQLVTVELTKIADNPWQPRAELDGIEDLALDIAAHGLLSPPMVRFDPEAVRNGTTYQLAFGHRRLAALRSLGWTFAEVELRELTDERMAIIALSENTKRRDLKPLETYRAWQKALEIEGLTVERLAENVGLDRSTVSNNLRLLRLPAYVLELVDLGVLSAHGAREFLYLMGADGHFHDDVAKSCLSLLTSGAPDWRVTRIRRLIGAAISQSSVNDFRKLFKGYAGGGHQADPLFDIDRFKADNAPKVHSIPNDDWTDDVWRDGERQPGRVKQEKSREWTCATRIWVARQKAHTSEAAKVAAPAAAGNAAEAPRTASFTKVLAADPLFVRVSQETKDEAKTLLKAFERLTGGGVPLAEDGKPVKEEDATAAAVREKLGTRAEPRLLQRGKSTFKGAIDPRQDGTYGYDHYQAGTTKPPAYFPDIAECRKTCTIGATYGHFDPKAPLALYCLNQVHWEEKVAQGRAAIAAKVDLQVQTADKTDAQNYEVIAKAFERGDAAVWRLLAYLLGHRQTLNKVKPAGLGWDETDELARRTANSERVIALLPGSDDLVKAEALKQMSPEDVREVLLRLLINHLNRDAAAASYAVNDMSSPASTDATPLASDGRGRQTPKRAKAGAAS